MFSEFSDDSFKIRICFAKAKILKPFLIKVYIHSMFVLECMYPIIFGEIYTISKVYFKILIIKYISERKGRD